MRFIRQLLHSIYFIESSFLVLLLISIIGLSVADIFMRNFFGSGLTIAAPLVRILVLWLGLLGALYATRHNKHITVDVLARLLSPSLRRVAASITAFFTSSVCGLIAWHGFFFVKDTWLYEDTVLGDFPAWIVQAVIPASFFLIALRFLFHGLGFAFSSQYPKEHGA